MITKASPDLALFVRLAALTGARRGQLCALHWSDVDLDAATIRWTRSLVKVPGGTVEKQTKTGARWSVALDPATVGALKEHRKRCVESAMPTTTEARRRAAAWIDDYNWDRRPPRSA